MKKLIFNTLSFRKLSFPDFKVEKMEYIPLMKNINIFIEGAWDEEDGGKLLGKGCISFLEWKSLTIKRYDPQTQIWTSLSDLPDEYLKDICDTRFDEDSNIILCGFGNKIGFWMEWCFNNAKVYAEFIPYN